MRTRLTLRGWLFVVTSLLSLPVIGYAQEARISGTVTDSTGGVLPGVTVTATHGATGNVFETVTDETGTYQLAVRVGTYRVTAALSGFQTVTREGLPLLLSQQAVFNLQLAPATVEETVTVTGEAPLIDTTSSTIGANIDPRQMEDLPVNGRNWMDLSLLAPGARRNEAVGFVQNRQGYAQTNIDGQQVTTIYHSGGDNEQPSYSRDAIAEFEVVANRFDASQGRSAGMVVNAITKSGTNTFAGTFSGYFRKDDFNAADFIEKRVLPYSNQQMSTTFGGPILRDRLHFFGSYEYEREPKTFAYNTPYPSFNIDLEHTRRAHKSLGRLDYQVTRSTRFSVRGQGYKEEFFNGGGSTTHPANAGTRGRITTQMFGTLTQVLGNRALNEIKGGRTAYERRDGPVVRWKGQKFPYAPVLDGGSVIVQVRGFTIGANPLNIMQDTWSLRDDFTTSYDWGGRHDLKLGGEYMWFQNRFKWCLRCMGSVDARGGAVPGNLEAMFPVWNDASTWNLAPLSPITTVVQHSLSSTEHQYTVVRNLVGFWIQDDWKPTNRLTFNLGVRYDFDDNAHSEKVEFRPWLPGNLPHDTNNLAPRLGLNYSLSDRTTVRGGYGLFFAFSPNDGVQQTAGYLVRFENEIANDGRADFVPNWFGSGPSPEGQWGGPKPTFDQSILRACDKNNSARGCVYRTLQQEVNYPGRQTPYSHQASVGIQRQLGTDRSFEANYVYTGGRLEEAAFNANQTYNAATGANNPFSNVALRAFPDWGVINFEMLEGWSNYHAADFTFTKRMSNRWQASATYTLASFRDANPVRDQWYLGSDGIVARRPIGFGLAPDLGGEYTLAASDQRHRAVLNGIWDIGYGFQLSGVYFFGSGERRTSTSGSDVRVEGGGAVSEQRLRTAAQAAARGGAIIPRNPLAGDPIHRMDMRLQNRIPLGGRVRLDAMLELFNIFNHANYGSYVTNESNARYGQPSFNDNIAYQPRVMQLGFRFGF